MKKRKRSGSIEVKASLAYTICSIIQKGLSFFTLPIFTRILTVEEYGQCTIYFSWMAIVSILTTLNLPYGTFSRAMVRFEDSRKQYISNVQMICILLTVLFLIVYIPLREYFNKYLELPTFIVVLMFAEILANFAILCWTGKQRYEYHYKSVIAVTLIIACLTVVSGLLFVLYSDDKGYARIFGYAIVTIAIGMGFLIYNFIKGKNPFRKDMWKYALGMNGVLIIYYVAQAIFNQSDRIMISSMIGIEQAAQYGVAYNLAIILTFVIDAINNSYIPWLYGKIKEGKSSENKKISVVLSIIIAFMLLGIIALAPELIYILAGEQYLEAKWVVTPVAMSLLLLFYSQQFINIEFYYEKKYLLVIASIAAAGLNIGLNYWLIPIYGFVAAGYTTLFSYLVFCLCNFLVVFVLMKRRKQKNELFHIPLLILVFVVFAGLGFLATFLYNYSLVRYIIIGVVLLGLLIGLKWLIPYIKKVFPRKENKDEVAETENK